MDFIVLGSILGAILMVAGIGMRDVVPRRLRVVGDDTPWIEVRDRRRTTRTLRAGGAVTTIAGAILLLVTVVFVVLDTSDGIAMTMVVGLAVVAVLVSVGWVVWFRYQESSGAIQRRQLRAIANRLGPAPSPARTRRAPPGGGRPRPHGDRAGAQPEREDAAGDERVRPAWDAANGPRDDARRNDRPRSGRPPEPAADFRSDTMPSGRSAGRPPTSRPERRESGSEPAEAPSRRGAGSGGGRTGSAARSRGLPVRRPPS